MKPLRLEMQAFGPYNKNTVIDFESITSSGLYLICGDTGSGKSYIFDGILYALFKETSCDERKRDSVRCEYADDKTPTRVIFEFKIKGERYRIERKKLGDKQSDSLVHLNEVNPQFDPLTKATDIKAKIEELLGLSSTNFTSIAMIAQGEFKKLLNTKTSERSELFRNVFDTGVYQKIEEKLKNNDSQLKANCVSRYNVMVNQLQNIEVTNQDDGYEELEAIKQKHAHSEKNKHFSFPQEDIDFLKQFQLNESNWLKESENKYKLLQENVEKYKKRLGELQEIENLKEQISNYKNNLALARENSTKLKAELKKLTLVQAEDEKLAHEKEKLKEDLDKLIELDRLRDEFIARNSDLSNSTQQYQDKNAELKEQKEEIESIEAYIQKHEDVNIQLAKKENDLKSKKELSGKYASVLEGFSNLKKTDAEISSLLEKMQNEQYNKDLLLEEEIKYKRDLEELDELIAQDSNQASLISAQEKTIEHLNNDKNRYAQDINRLDEIEKQIGQTQTTINELSDSLKKKQEQVIKAKLEHTKLQELFLRNQAGILGMELKDDSPCPVCGSLHHPNPAHREDNCPTEDEIQSAEDAWKTLEIEEQSLKNDCFKADADLMTQKGEYDRIASNYGGVDSLYKAHAQKIEEIAEASKKLDVLFESKRRLQTNENKKHEVNSNLSQVQTQIVNLSEDINKINDSIQSKKGSKEEQERTLSQYNEQEIAQQCQLLETELVDLSKQIHVLAEESKLLNDKKLRKTALVADVRNLEDQLKKLQDKMHSDQSASDTAKALYESRERELGDKEPESIKERICTIEEHIDKNKRIKEHTDNLFNKAQADIHTNEQLISEKQNSLAKFEPGDMESARNNYDNALQKAEEFEQLYKNSNKRILHNIDVIDQLIDWHAQYQVESQQYDLVHELQEVANGGTEGHKMKFETYLQGMYLDMVLEEANKRFIPMTDGRYRLLHSSTPSGNKKIGLDINVYDLYSHSQRSASTLSGGETFKASLSLALGMSDIASKNAGGISVDCMFIDEGFGTLNDGSRGSTMKALIDLTQGDKSVGMISHISEVKEYISNQIIVTGGENGSTVKLVRDI